MVDKKHHKRANHFNNEPLIIGIVIVISTLIYTVYTLNLRTNISLQSRAAAGNPVCTSNFAVPTLTPVPCVDTPIQLMLVMDRSSSMINEDWVDLNGNGREDPDEKKTKLEWSKLAAKELVRVIGGTPLALAGKVRVGVVSFGRSLPNSVSSTNPSKTHIRLTNVKGTGLDSVQAAIDGVNYEGSGTCIQCGERRGRWQFQNNPPPPEGVTRIVIETTDGRANHIIDSPDSAGRGPSGDAAIAEASIIKNTYNAKIFVAAYTSPDSKYDGRIVTGIASEGQNTCLVVPDASSWDDVFAAFFENICPSAAMRKIGSPMAASQLTSCDPNH